MVNINLWYNIYVQRVLFTKKGRNQFFYDLFKKSKVSLNILASHYGISGRTFRDWRRGKFLPSLEILRKTSKDFKIKLPSFKILPQYWYITSENTRKAALARMMLYGPPGTPEGRRKGGLISQKRRRLHPELFQHCNLRKEIIKPENGNDLAELFGIILGDGGISSDYQVVITLNSENDRQYALFVSKLIKKLFGLTPVIYKYRSLSCQKVVGVTINSVAVIEFLLHKGLLRGSKVKHQIDVPNWIKEKPSFSKSCLRGLMDTDGGVYYHKHSSNSCKCFNIGLCFTNKSLPLLNFVKDTLSAFNFTPRFGCGKRNVFLYRENEVIRYAKKIGFSNPYHLGRVKKFLQDKRLRKGAGVA